MRIGDSRYRWEFRLLPGETADDYAALDALRPLIAPWVGDVPPTRPDAGSRDGVHLSREDRRPVAPRKHLPARRRRTSHSTVHRPGHGRRTARCDEPGVEARRLVLDRRPATPRPGHATNRNENRTLGFMIALALSMGWAMTAGGESAISSAGSSSLDCGSFPDCATSSLESKTPALRRSALVSEARVPGQLAGTLCPNPVTAEGIRLDAVLGNSFAMITTDAPTAAQQCALLEERGAVVHVAEPGGELARWLRRGRRNGGDRPARPHRHVRRPGPERAVRRPCRGSVTEELRSHAEGAATAFPTTGRTSTRPTRSSTRIRTTPGCGCSDPWFGCRGTTSTRCHASPSARPPCATTRHSSPKRAWHSTVSPTGSPAAPR